MGKKKTSRRVADNEAMAKLRMLRTSPQKLNLVAGLIRGKKVDKALNDLTFSKKRIAVDVKKCLQSAIANAENNHGLDVDELIVADRRFDLVALPGGMPGAEHLRDCEPLAAILRDQHARGGPVAAICAAPSSGTGSGRR